MSNSPRAQHGRARDRSAAPCRRRGRRDDLAARRRLADAQLGRDRGKALEPGLWDEWGGSPTLQVWRQRETPADRYDTERLNRLSTLIRERLTRARAAQFPLILQENINY